MLIPTCRRSPAPASPIRPASALAASLLLAGLPGAASAGGFEMGANGTEALGRAGAFTAKADSPLALEYNVAGLAQQRGTRVLFDSNLFFSDYRFQRTGGDALGPYAEVSDHAQQPFYAPWFGLTTDFGYFKRWTFSIGGFGPASVGRHDFGIFASSGGTRGGAGRYDVVATDLLIIQPTFAVAFHAHRVIDIGLSVQQVSAVLNLASASYVSQAVPNHPESDACAMQSETPGCDTFTRVQVRSFNNFALQLGLLLHPIGGLHIGAHVRSAVNLGIRPIEATGIVSATDPPNVPLSSTFGDAAATAHMNALFTTWLPWILRAGVRYAFGRPGREIADIELDATYEMWGQIDGSDNTLTLQNPPQLVNGGNPITIRLTHNFHDTFSLRLGGSFTQPIGPEAGITLRLGALYDSSSSPTAFTRIDFDTLAKVGATAGLGFRVRGFTVNAAYAYLHSLPRTVTDGELRPIDGQTGKDLMIGGQLAPAINNGTYSGHNHIVSVGVTFLFDEIVHGSGWRARRGLAD